MTPDWLLIVCGIAVVAGGLVSGVFLAFSDFVMKSLASASPAGGIESMQVINRKVYNSIFLVLILGMAAFSLFLTGYTFFRVSGSASVYILAGGTIYIAGVILVTFIFNVPMNQRLDAMDYSAADSVSYWANYVPSWTFWNHIRTIASTVSTICYLIGCILLARETIAIG